MTVWGAPSRAAENLFLVKGLALCLNVYEDDVSELILSVIGDADGSYIAVNLYPLVILGVLQIARYVHNRLYLIVKLVQMY